MINKSLIRKFLMRTSVDIDADYYRNLVDYSITIEHEYKDGVDITIQEVFWNSVIHDIEFGDYDEITITYKELNDFLYNERIKKLNSL